jgi:hypothetical protein
MNRRIIHATPNKSNRTFTLDIVYSDGDTAKYRTSAMGKAEFEECMYNTQSDWAYFLSKNECTKLN